MPGVDEAQWARAAAILAPGLSLRFAVGVHPQREGDARTLATWVDRLGATAIGEVGWHRGVPHRDALVDAHVELARERDLPLILHVVGTHGHALERLRRHPPLRGVVHAYSGSAELVREYVSLGLHVSIGPSVLNENARKVHAACVEIPEDRLLIETDAPDQIAEPADLRSVAARVASLRGATLDEVAERTTRNAVSLFGHR